MDEAKFKIYHEQTPILWEKAKAQALEELTKENPNFKITWYDKYSDDLLSERTSKIYRKMLNKLMRELDPRPRDNYKEISKWLDSRVLEEMENYKESAASISVRDMYWLIDSYSVTKEWDDLSTKQREILIQQSLNRLAKQGKIKLLGMYKGNRFIKTYRPVIALLDSDRRRLY
ncbi:MAG: hypothetical protein WC783_02835 [Candidatus Paceibacterota bacterium]|jgi:3-methyladenine DNA glycosylase AlkC